MGEQAVSGGADVLVTIGLGSCIGLALIERSKGVAGLAHVVLPDSHEAHSGQAAAKFADTAVPALVEALEALGAATSRLEAVLVGGAQMFAFTRGEGSNLDVGARNDAAVTAALDRASIPVRAKATGGSKGRTIRVHVVSGFVTVREAGGAEEHLFGPTTMPKAA
jgi:chemotaxis protein CheD